MSVACDLTFSMSSLFLNLKVKTNTHHCLKEFIFLMCLNTCRRTFDSFWVTIKLGIFYVFLALVFQRWGRNFTFCEKKASLSSEWLELWKSKQARIWGEKWCERLLKGIEEDLQEPGSVLQNHIIGYNEIADYRSYNTNKY